MERQERFNFSFYSFWIIFGIVQIFLIQGCSKNISALERGGSGSTQNSAVEAVELPVRVSRAFFERSLTGDIKVENTPDQDEIQSDVEWVLHSPEAPLPQGEILNDGRDQKGCAIYNQAGVQLCFRIMGDVSSVGLNELEVRLEGLPAQFGSNPRFVSASRGGGALSVVFSTDNSTRVELNLRQI